MKRLFSAPTHLFLLVVSSLNGSVHGHGMLTSPRSRNYYASVEGATWGTQAGLPPAEYCPHCINLKSADQVCGTGQAQNYDIWTDMAGNPMPWLSQGTYTEGQEIFIESTLTTNHAGHIDVFVCPDGNASTQQCFLNNPLTFVEDMMHGGPVDEDYPSRAYVSPAGLFRFKYRLPMGVYGQQVMLQWRYVTANSCIPPGYRRTDLGLQALGWLRSPGMADCSWPLNWTGDRDSTNPEQFWNCADITIRAANPTPSVPTPSTRAPVVAPVASPVEPPPVPTPSNGGCCSVNGSEACGPTWCSASKSNCEGTCGGNYIGGPTEPTPTVPTAPITPTPPTPTVTSQATTTRYWDCSGGSCGCAYLPFGPGTDSEPAHCYSNAMFAAPAGNKYGAKYYGTAAISQALGGGNWNAEGCGKCWKVRGWSNIAGKDIFQTTMVLKGTNYCPPENPACSGTKAHFDIAAPGFDVTEFSFSNTCSVREAEEIEGFNSCGRWMIDSQNPDVGCDCSKFKNPVLRAGCDNFFSLLWDNAAVDYEEVNCPSELTRLNCWEENGGKYPDGVPEFCASNVETTPTAPTTPTQPTPTAPVPSPVLVPTPTTTQYCCSSDLMNCKPDNDWCAQSIANCNVCGAKWIEKNPSCSIPWWGDCFNDRDGCCPPATCHDYGTWAMCDVSPTAPVASTPMPVNTPVANPVANPTPLSPTTPVTATDNSRLIAYLGNWQTCPTASQLEQYTHIVIAFAVSYVWNPSKNICSSTCEISDPLVCENSANLSLISEWQAAGKKVILSFGGAGMGGSWSSSVDDCWEYCYGREPQVVNRLVEIVNNMGLDGVDLDFEYHITSQAVTFLNQVTTGLRNSLPAGSEITHAPMDPDVMPGKAYYEDVLKVVGGTLDYLMPQYYNGFTRPAIDGVDGTGSGSISALSHYTDIVNDIFDGDAKRMVFGFCISDCSGTGSNASSQQASKVMTDLATYYPCNGGAFFWVVFHDVGGSWSSDVGSTVQTLGESNCDTTPTKSPQPSAPFVSTPSPTKSPTVITNPCCPAGYTGLRAWNECLQYFHCVNGVVTGDLLNVPDGTLFDQNIQNFNHAHLVTCVVDNCGGTTSSPVSSTPAPVASTPAPVPTTLAPVDNPTPCADRIDQWKINDMGKKKNWCNWLSSHSNTSHQCTIKSLKDECPVTCGNCPSNTPAPVSSTAAPVASTSAPIASTSAPVSSPTSNCACSAEMAEMKSEMADMKSEMETLKTSLEDLINGLQTLAPVTSTPAPVAATPAPFVCADRTDRWEINGKTRSWCSWADRQANTSDKCKDKNLNDDCPVTCGVCTP